MTTDLGALVYDCPQHFVSARTTICGSFAMMYSPDSCG